MKLPHQNIKVEVNFYDEEQKEKLLVYPTSQQIVDIVHNGVQIPIEEFLTYYLFYRKRPGKIGYRNYEELGKKIGKSLSDLEDFITFNGLSIATPADIGKQDLHITERVGESIGLSIVNRIHNLSEADWDRIPAKGGPFAPKVFDYQVASDGSSIVQVEAKGSSITNNESKSNTVSNHKSLIIKRKEAIRELEAKQSYPYPANLRYGTITVLDNRPKSTVKCLLVDPEPSQENTTPAKLRLINRMRFLRDWISFISLRSQFASALSTRVAELEVLSDPFELEGIPLLKGTGEPFEIIPTPDAFGRTLGFLMYKSRVTDGPSCGIITRISKNALFFLGIRDELAVLAAEQHFTDIFEYKSSIGTTRKTVQCVLHKRRYERLKLPEWITGEASQSGDYVSFKVTGELVYSQEGLVFGVLPIGNAND